MNKLIILVLAICIISIGSYLLLSRPNQVMNRNETPSDPSVILQGLATKLELTPELRDYNYMDWLDEEGKLLPLRGKQFIVGTVNSNGIGKYLQIPDNDLSAITTENLAPLIQASETYFAENGFSKNKQNTRTVGSNSITAAFYGFEKGPTKCVIRIDEQTDPFGNFVCGIVDTDQQKMQKEFLPLFIGTDRDGDKITSIRVQKLESEYAMGSANGVYAGYTWMAKKTNGAWAVVWRGQEIPLCTEMEKYGIPKSIYENCYNEPA